MSKTDSRKELARQIAARTTKHFGERTAHVATSLGDVALGVTSTGILALDYMTGIGGIPEGFPVEFFGAPDIGKSTIIGLGSTREAQRAGKLCGWIAMEPSFDEKWAVKHGIDPDLLVVAYPDNGEDAFAILHDWVTEGVPDFIVFDSLGALKPTGKAAEEGKPKAFGASGLISAGLTNVAPTLYKKNISLVLLNQQRADTKAQIPGLVESPGGWALRHLCPLRVHLKAGRDRYTVKIGEDNVLIGRKLQAHIKRNKLAESSAPGRKAQFDFYHMEVEGEPFGLDIGQDVASTGILAGVIKKNGGWYSHHTFPKGKLNGSDKVAEFVKDNPEAYKVIRQEVLNAMVGDLAKPELEEAQS